MSFELQKERKSNRKIKRTKGIKIMDFETKKKSVSIRLEGRKVEKWFGEKYPKAIPKKDEGDFDFPYKESFFPIETKNGKSNTINQIKAHDGTVLVYIYSEDYIIVIPAIRVLIGALRKRKGQHSPDPLTTVTASPKDLINWGGVICNDTELEDALIKAHEFDLKYSLELKFARSIYENRYKRVKEENNIMLDMFFESRPELKE